MSMIRTLMLAGIAFASVAAMSAATPAHAEWRWRQGPHGGVRFWAPAVVVAGPPVVYAAPPAYYAPPVAYAPPPVVYAPPAVVIGAPFIGVRIR